MQLHIAELYFGPELALAAVGGRSYAALVDTTDRAGELRRLHTDPDLLVLVNVWDVASARTVADLPGCRAIATASHSVAAAHGYPDEERIPRDLMLATVERITDAVELPVTADIEAGYGDTEDTVRRAIGAGAVGGNLEDGMRPLDAAVAQVEAVVRAGTAEGVPFVLNARTDAYLQAGDRDPGEVFDDAVERGRAFLDAGADCVFVPGVRDTETVGRLVERIGERKISLMAGPGSPSLAELADLGVARVSFGPWTHWVALTALADIGAGLLARTGAIPPDTRTVG
jgi:2-methylisocitrate lyase-like PEP mutase family enzyme